MNRFYKSGGGREFFVFWSFLIVAFLALFLIRAYTGGVVYQEYKYDISEIPKEIEINLGDGLYLDVDAGPGYSFSDDTDLFDIDPLTGVVDFVPESRGEYYFVVIALSDVDRFDYRLVKLRVV